MIENVGQDIIFYSHYVASKVGKTGLTVTIDVWQIERDGTATEIVTGGSAVEVGDGVYRYLLADSSVDEPAEYVGVFKTGDSSVDQQHIPALWVVDRAGVENLDAAVSSRLKATDYAAPDLSLLDAAVSSRLPTSGYTAPNNAGIAAIKARTDNLPDDPADQSAVESAIASAVTPLATAANVTAATSVLSTFNPASDKVKLADGELEGITIDTQSIIDAVVGALGDLAVEVDVEAISAAVAQRLAAALEQGTLAVQSALVDGTLHVYRGDTISVIFTGLGDLTGRTALYLAAKWSADDADGEAVLEVSETGGLLRLNGGEATAGWGSLTVDDAAEGVATLSLAAEATAMLAPNTYVYDVQMVTAEGVRTVGAGTVVVTADIKRAVT